MAGFFCIIPITTHIDGYKSYGYAIGIIWHPQQSQERHFVTLKLIILSLCLLFVFNIDWHFF